MQSASIPDDEQRRLLALNQYSILDSEAEEVFDEIVALASFICDTPISTITLIDDHRQWFKSSMGLADSETPRDVAFCAHAILQDDIMIIKDATKDIRFQDNPLVTGTPDIRFYAGMPLISPEGFKLGTICVIDTKPRDLSEKQNFALKVLSNQVMKLLELRRKNAELERIHEMHNRLLSIIGHDLRSPITSIDGLLLLAEKYSLGLQEFQDLVPRLRRMVDTTNDLLSNLLHWAKSQIEGKVSEKKFLSLKLVSQNIINANSILFASKGNIIFNRIPENHFAWVDKNMIDFVFRNLILNANKFMNNGTVTIDSKQLDHSIEVSVTDTGVGIDDAIGKNIFLWGKVESTEGTNGEKGSGFGLPMSKEFIEMQGGVIRFTTTPHTGTTFYFTLPSTTSGTGGNRFK